MKLICLFKLVHNLQRVCGAFGITGSRLINGRYNGKSSNSFLVRIFSKIIFIIQNTKEIDKLLINCHEHERRQPNNSEVTLTYRENLFNGMRSARETQCLMQLSIRVEQQSQCKTYASAAIVIIAPSSVR